MKKILLVSAMVFSTMSCFAQKFGHVNTTELVQLCPEADKAREILKASTAEAQATYKEMADEYNTKLEAYQQKSSSWTGTIRSASASNTICAAMSSTPWTRSNGTSTGWSSRR